MLFETRKNPLPEMAAGKLLGIGLFPVKRGINCGTVAAEETATIANAIHCVAWRHQ